MRAYGSSRSHRTRFPFLGAGSRRGSPSTRSTSFVTESYYQHRALERWPWSPRRSLSPHPPPHLVNKIREREKEREKHARSEHATTHADRASMRERWRHATMRAHRVCVCSRGQGFQALPRVAWRFVNELVIDETHWTERHVWRNQEPIYNHLTIIQFHRRTIIL